MEMRKHMGAETVKGAWNAMKRGVESAGTKGIPSLKEYARLLAAHSSAGDGTADSLPVRDAVRWLQAKRPGGTDAERKARREKRRDQQSIRSAAPVSGKGGGLKPSGKGKGRQ